MQGMRIQQSQPILDPLQGHPYAHKYVFLSTMARGTFGFVYLYRNLLTHEPVAIKFLERGDRVSKYVEFEINNHRILRHPNVIEFKEVFLTNRFIAIVMEYASGGNLFMYVQQGGLLQEPVARWFFQHICIGLDYCHRRGVVNRDLKLDNTLLEIVPNLPLPLPKICDFGYSKSEVVSTPKSKVGTLAYMSPEVIRGGQYDGKPADIWSCGVMLYIMLFGQYPFDMPQEFQQQRRIQSMITRIMSMQWNCPAHIPISPQCQDILQRILVADSSQRLTMEAIQQHPWFLENLPRNILTMNDQFLASTDDSDVQSEEEVRSILEQAKADVPTPLEDMIDKSIAEEVGQGSSSSLAQRPRDFQQMQMRHPSNQDPQGCHNQQQQ